MSTDEREHKNQSVSMPRGDMEVQRLSPSLRAKSIYKAPVFAKETNLEFFTMSNITRLHPFKENTDKSWGCGSVVALT